MNTVDPNIKVQEQFSEPIAASEQAPVAAAPVLESPAVASPAAPVEVKTNGNAQVRAEPNLPANHHHRSTALW